MSNITFWMDQVENKMKVDHRLVDECTETILDVKKIIQELGSDIKDCTAALKGTNTILTLKCLTQSKEKLPETDAVKDEEKKEDVPSVSIDLPPFAVTGSEDVDMYSSLDPLVDPLDNTGYNPQYPQYHPPEYAAPISPGDICTPSANSPQASNGLEWNQHVSNQIDQLSNQPHIHHPDAVPPAVTPPPVRLTRSTQ